MCHAAVWHAGHSWHRPLSTAGWAVHVAGHANAGDPRLTLLTVNQWIGRRAPRPLGTMTKGSVLPLLAATDGQAHMIFNLNDAACLLSSLFCSMWRTNPILKKCAGPFPPSIGAMNPYGVRGLVQVSGMVEASGVNSAVYLGYRILSPAVSLCWITMA